MVMNQYSGGAFLLCFLPGSVPSDIWARPPTAEPLMKVGEDEDKEPRHTYSGRNLHLKVPAGNGHGAKQQGEGWLWNIKEGMLLSFSVFKSLGLQKKETNKGNLLIGQQYGLYSYPSKRSTPSLPQTCLLLWLFSSCYNCSPVSPLW